MSWTALVMVALVMLKRLQPRVTGQNATSCTLTHWPSCHPATRRTPRLLSTVTSPRKPRSWPMICEEGGGSQGRRGSVLFKRMEGTDCCGQAITSRQHLSFSPPLSPSPLFSCHWSHSQQDWDDYWLTFMVFFLFFFERRMQGEAGEREKKEENEKWPFFFVKRNLAW